MKKIFEGFSQSFDDGNYIDTFSKDDNNTKSRIQACSQIVFSASEKLNYFSPDSKAMEKILYCFPTYKSGSLKEGKLRSPWYIYNHNNSTAYAVQIKDAICLTYAKRDLHDCFITPQYLWENNYIDKNSFKKLIDNYFGKYSEEFSADESRLKQIFTQIRDVLTYDNTTNIVCMIGYLPALDSHVAIFSPDDNSGKDYFLENAAEHDTTDGWSETKGYYEDDWNIPGIVTTDYNNTLKLYFLQSNIERSGDMGIEEFIYYLIKELMPKAYNDKDAINAMLDDIEEMFYANNNSWRKFFETYYTLLFNGYLKYLEKNVFTKYDMSDLNNCFLFDDYSVLWEYVRVQGGSN